MGAGKVSHYLFSFHGALKYPRWCCLTHLPVSLPPSLLPPRPKAGFQHTGATGLLPGAGNSLGSGPQIRILPQPSNLQVNRTRVLSSSRGPRRELGSSQHRFHCPSLSPKPSGGQVGCGTIRSILIPWHGPLDELDKTPRFSLSQW